MYMKKFLFIADLLLFSSKSALRNVQERQLSKISADSIISEVGKNVSDQNWGVADGFKEYVIRN
jgi:hypothetical protein